MVDAENRERRRLAEGLHEDVAQILSACSIKLSLLDDAELPEAVRQVHRELDELLDDANEKVRDLNFELSSSQMLESGLEEGFRRFCGRLQQLYQIPLRIEGGLDKECDNGASAVVLFDALRTLAFGLARQCRGEKQIRVRMQCDRGTAHFSLEESGDPAASVRPAHPPRSGGIDFFGIRERLRDIGGGMLVESRTDGRKIILHAPMTLMKEETHESEEDSHPSCG